MPTSSQRIITLNRQPILIFKDNTIRANKSIQPIETVYTDRDKEQSSFNTKPSTPEETRIFMDDLQELSEKQRCTPLQLTALLVLLALLVLSLVAIAIVLPLALKQKDSITSTVTTTIITTSVTTTTSTPSCMPPYVRASSGNCINTLLDFDNCGAIGNSCSNNYTSCSAAVCSIVPVVQVSNATSIWTGGVNGSADDNIFNVTLPFTVTLYNTTTSHIQVTTNGVLCLSNCADAWLNSGLPSNSFGAAILPYWDDLYIYAKTWQGIYFASQGNAPNRMLVFEYYMSHYGSSNQFYHFQVVFFEASPGIVQFIYFDAGDTGVSCTVGVQGSSSGPFIQYSFDQSNSVQPNMTLTFNTILGSYTNSTIG